MSISTEELVDKLRASCMRGEGLNNYAVIYDDGTYDIKLDQICFFGVHDLLPYDKRRITHFIDNPLGRFDRAHKELVIPYMTWLMNESAWSEAFITKDPEEVFKKGMLLDVSWSIRYLLQAAIGLRYLHEKRYIVEGWSFLSKHIEPHLALYLAHFYNTVGSDGYLFRLSGARAVYDNHAFINYVEVSKDALLRMVRKDLSTVKKCKPFSQQSNFSGMMKVWYKANEYRMSHRYLVTPVNEDRPIFPEPNAEVKEVVFGKTRTTPCFLKADVEKNMQEFLRINNFGEG